MKLTGIHLYPVKSLGGIACHSAEVTPIGLQFDRRWMLADSTGKFITQRELPGLTQFSTAIERDVLVVYKQNNPSEKVEIPLFPKENILLKKTAIVWKSRCSARLMPEEFSRWFSEIMGQELFLLWMPPSTRRRTSFHHAPGHHVSFADGYPILMIGENSLADLNQKLEIPVPMNRFRPNLVFEGADAYFEETLQHFSIGNQHFKGVKPCGRCIMTTIDQNTGVRNTEPLRTLASYKKRGNSVIFGQNVVWLGTGTECVIRVGDALSVM